MVSFKATEGHVYITTRGQFAHRYERMLPVMLLNLAAEDGSQSTLGAQLEALGHPKPFGPIVHLEWRRFVAACATESDTGVEGMILNLETYLAEAHDDHTGRNFVRYLGDHGIATVIKIDQGMGRLNPSFPLVRGLDRLNWSETPLGNLAESGVEAVKFRAAVPVGASHAVLMANGWQLALITLAVQQKNDSTLPIIPIPEPEVLYSGTHDVGACVHTTEQFHRAFFDACLKLDVQRKQMIVKTNMMTSGSHHQDQTSPEETADRTINELSCWPSDVRFVFLSGGQAPALFTARLNAIIVASLGTTLEGRLGQSASRARDSEAMPFWVNGEFMRAAQIWKTRSALLNTAQNGLYSEDMEDEIERIKA